MTHKRHGNDAASSTLDTPLVGDFRCDQLPQKAALPDSADVTRTCVKRRVLRRRETHFAGGLQGKNPCPYVDLQAFETKGVDVGQNRVVPPSRSPLDGLASPLVPPEGLFSDVSTTNPFSKPPPDESLDRHERRRPPWRRLVRLAQRTKLAWLCIELLTTGGRMQLATTGPVLREKTRVVAGAAEALE
jgi:hypothetical protein